MKKIVRGNDCTLKIPVKKMVDGQLETFPLPACTDVVVNLVTSIRRYPLSYTISTTQDHVILASVKGGTMPLAKMALEVKGKMFDCDWRSNEYEQVEFVDNNASGDTAFSPDDEDEGEQSVEMDTAVVVLAPSADLTLLIKQAEEAVSAAKSETATATEAEAQRAASETARQQAEEGRVGAEAARVSTEQTREAREAERQTAETLRQANETARNDNEQARQSAETQREADMKKAVDEAVERAKVSVSYLPDEGALAIVTEE